MDEKIEKRKDVFVQRSEASTNRFIQSLKSLFNYLTTESEDKTGECYFYRNVMVKVHTPRKTESAARRAKRISSQILDKDEMDGLLEFVRNEYEQQLDSSHAASFFKRNRIRDIAIISLFQGSGIRVNELAGLQTFDIDSIKGDINVVRKGNKKDTVSITPSSLADLMAHIEQRDELYKPDPKNKFVFLTRYGGKANPIGVEAVRALITKYSEAYLAGKRLKPHQLRHSFAKRWLGWELSRFAGSVRTQYH